MPNLSQLKRERMLAFLQKIKDEHRDDDDMLIALGEIESELTSKKYGLVWEQHEEAVDVMMRDNIPVFTEVPEREITAAPGQGYNFILEGDNLHSLRLLEKTHKGKIDLIYIDPPYNTGSKDFIYDDAIVDKTDLFSHSKWLSFMDKRLRIARQLMSDKGVIFISIDDNEEAPLKMLCDDIFGADCFVANIAWQRTYSMRNDSKGIPAEVEHILVYSRNGEWMPKKLARTEAMNSLYKNIDNDPKGAWRNTTPYHKASSMFFIGRNTDYAVALEGALKMKEISYIHAESYAAGELKHGTIALIHEGQPVVALCCNDAITEKTMSNIVEVKARGAEVLAVAGKENQRILSLADDMIYVPKIHPLFSAAIEIVPLQMLAYRVAKENGCDIDKPKNLAKSVTVE